MALPKGNNVEDDPPAPRFILSGLPSGVTASEIETCLYTVNEDITDLEVTVLGGGKASAVVHGILDIEGFVKRKHRLGRQCFHVEIDPSFSPSTPPVPPVLADMIQVTGDLPDIQLLEWYFEGVKSGGGEEKEVETIKEIKKGVVHVKFSSKEDAALVVEHKFHSTYGKVLQVCYAPDPSAVEEKKDDGPLPKAAADCWQLSISNIPKDVSKEYLAHFVESRLGLEQEKDFTVDLQPPGAHLAFSTERDLEEMAKKLTSKELKSHKLVVGQALPTTSEEATCMVEPTPGKLLITDIPSGIEAEILELFIEGVLGLECQKDYTLAMKLPKAHVLLSSTCSEKEMEVMCKKLMFKTLKGQRLTVEQVHEVPKVIDPKKILISDIPQNVPEEFLTLFIESRLGLKTGDFTLAMSPPKALLTFIHDHSVKELEQQRLSLMSKALGGQLLTVELCEKNRSILVRGIMKKLFSVEALDLYFNSPSTSGEDTVEAIKLVGSDTALITFKDPQVVSSVLSRNHPRLGANVSVVAHSPLDSFDSQSHRESQSDDEENFQDASAEPSTHTEPLTITVDPLIAKYLMRNLSVVSMPLECMYLSVEIDLTNDAITLTPSSSSPAGWPMKSKEMVHEALSSNVAQEVLRIPPEAASQIFPTIMTSCNEGELQYNFSNDNMLISIAGDCGRVNALKRQIDDLCTQYIEKDDRITLSEEEFTFVVSLRCANIGESYPNVQLHCHASDHSVSLRGPIRYVDEFKEHLPQIVAHSKVPVFLHPLIVRFLHKEHGRKHLEKILQQVPVVPFFCTSQQEDDGSKNTLSLSLLSSIDKADTAETLVVDITNGIKMETHPLPKSFHAKVSSSPHFENFKKKLHKQFPFLVNVENDQLLVVSTAEHLQQVANSLTQHIMEACSVTKTIRLKRGVWRLFHSSATDRWELIKKDMEGKRVQLLHVTKERVRKPSVTIKGEFEAAEDIEERILQLQSSVKTKEVPVSRPGICKYLFDDAAGRMVISGLEHKAKVCIELGVEEDQTTEDTSVAGAQQKLTKVCWGATSETKTISIYVGDITEFNKAEVIVNAANENLQHVGGVALGIARKGGPIIQKDSDDHIHRKGKIDTGNAVIFHRVGDLPKPYKAIVHAVGPQWNSRDSKERQVALLKKAVRNALVRAKDYGSIAVPAISAGVYGCPIDVSASALIDGSVEFSKKEPQAALNEINIVIFSRKDAEVFQKALVNALETVFSESKSTVTPRKPAIPETTPDTSVRKKRKAKSTVGTPVQSLATPLSFPSVAFSSSPTTRQAALDYIKVTNGSILDANCEALVNTTDQNLGFGGYVSQALLKAAGDSLKTECDKKKPVAMGGIAVTGAGNLKCKHIIHTVLPNYDGPSGMAEKTLKSVVVQCLQQCTQLGLKSIAIPSIGAGNLKYPDTVVAQCLLNETLRYLEANHGKTSLQLVHFVVFMPRTFQAFEDQHRTLVSGRAEEDENEEDEEDLVTSSHLSHGLTPSRMLRRQRGHPKAERSSQSQEGVCDFCLPNGLVLEVVLGDISDDSSDVIVNPTSPNLVLVQQGVQGAILRKGGQELQDACISLSKGRPCLTEGKVLETPSYGRLCCKSVYHIHYSSNDRKKFTKTILACLERANSTKRKSIAFPAIGTGMNRYSVSEAASGMVRALKKFINKNKTVRLEVVRVVLFQEDVHQQFVQAFESVDEGGEEGFLQKVVRGFKAVGSYFFSTGDQDEDEDEPVGTTNQEMDETSVDEEWVSIPSNVTFAMNTTVVLTIYGMTEPSVEMAEKNLRSVIDRHIVSEEIDDPCICQLSVQMVESLEKEAKDHQVDIDIDQDKALHTINLRGCQSDVLAIKDKVRDALAALSKEKTKADAADAVYATIRWTRCLSGEETDEYDPLTNYEIEQAYRRKQEKFMYKGDTENFIVDFTNFRETDCITHDVVEIRRRDLLKEYSSESKPEEWDRMPTDPSGKECLVHLVKLKPGSKEYQNVESHFMATMSGVTLSSIERVQNPVLYGQYINYKKQMDKRNPPGHQNERWLFHGTSPDTCSKINNQGFNRSFMGKNGTAYGQGVYFARDARLSNGYTTTDAQGKRRMYFTRVLCGEYTIGRSSMIIPPPKNAQQNAHIPFDSTVDNISNPSIVVVYNDSQNYPAYLITYS